ncbi:MAG: hypothetical protein KIS67_16730 [Verrucomicrobiae bacterium]|nr:hypothetical protein [Verrucomicrobiae bacterium]
MNSLFITAASLVSEADVRAARLGSRFGRLDLASQLALLAVEKLAADFDGLGRERVGICLTAAAGSLSTDAAYWNGRAGVGGPSPTLFAYTLPSAAIGEIAIRHRLMGPNLCFVGHESDALSEAAHLILRGEAAACLAVFCHVVTPALAAMIQWSPAARAGALLLQRLDTGLHRWRENDRDIAAMCSLLSAR